MPRFMEREKIKKFILPAIWILIGILMVIYGVSNYWRYSTPGIMWLMMIPEYESNKAIILGILSMIIGFQMLNVSSKYNSNLLKYTVLIIVLNLAILIYKAILFRGLCILNLMEVLLNFDLLLLLVAIVTILLRKKEIQIIRSLNHLKSKLPSVFFECALYIILILVLPHIFNYELILLLRV
jgi:hypothetical protein